MSLGTRDMHIKTTMDSHYTTTKMAKIQKTDHMQCQ